MERSASVLSSSAFRSHDGEVNDITGPIQQPDLITGSFKTITYSVEDFMRIDIQRKVYGFLSSMLNNDEFTESMNRTEVVGARWTASTNVKAVI